MKKIIILLTFILIVFSCKTIQHNNGLKIIKHKKFNEIKYDWYSHIDVKGNYCIYIKNGIIEGKKQVKTNYVFGDFELMSYNNYLKDKNNGSYRK